MPPEPFRNMLEGGHPNSLGRAEEVVDVVLADPDRLEELFEATVGADDELVRMRAGDALEKVCRRRQGWLVPLADRLLDEAGPIQQPSVQWHVAQILQRLRGELSGDQARRATGLLESNLAQSSDWIVLNVTMDVLVEWCRDDPALREWLIPELERLHHDERKSVAKRASRHLTELRKDGSDGT